MASYPSAIYNGRTMANRAGVSYDVAKTKVIFAEDFNLDRAEITAIETELGTLPKGSSASVKARLEAIEASIPASGGGNSEYKFRAYISSDVTIANDTATAIVFDSENFDPGSDFNTATGQYTVPVTGYYFLSAGVRYQSPVASKYIYIAIRVNSNIRMLNYNHTSNTNDCSAFVSGVYYLTAGQTIDVTTRHNCGGNELIDGQNQSTFLSGHLLSI